MRIRVILGAAIWAAAILALFVSPSDGAATQPARPLSAI